MTISVEPREASLARDWLRYARHRFGGRMTILVVSAAAIVGGMALNWNWLVATGLAPLLLTLLPCAVMCALGLCMHRMEGQHGSGGGIRREALSDRKDDRDDSEISGKAQDCCGSGHRAANTTEPRVKVNESRDLDG